MSRHHFGTGGHRGNDGPNDPPGRGWNFGDGNWQRPGGGFANPPVARPPSPAPPAPPRPAAPRPAPPAPAPARVTHTTVVAGNPGTGGRGSPTGGPQPNPAQSSSGPGAEPGPDALNALGGPANVGSGSAESSNSSDPSRTVSGSSTGTGATGLDSASTASSHLVHDPASGVSKGPPLAGILAGVFGGLLIILAITAGVILFRRRKRRAQKIEVSLDSQEDDRSSEPRPYTLPAPPSPPHARPPRAHGLALDTSHMQDRDVDRYSMRQTQLYSPVMSPVMSSTFTRDSKSRHTYLSGDQHLGEPHPAWSRGPMDYEGSIVSSDPDVYPDHPTSEASLYVDPPPAYQTGSMTAPLSDVKMSRV